MPPKTYTTEEITGYLFGAIPKAESDKLEEAYFENSILAVKIAEIENDLVDDYVRGHLPARERKLFEKHYLPNPNHRRRVENARVLLSKFNELAKNPVSFATKKASWWQNLLEFFLGNQMPVVAATLTILFIVFGGLYLWSRNSRLNQPATDSQIAQSSGGHHTPTLPRQTPAEPQSKDQVTQEIAKSRAQPSSKRLADASEIPTIKLTVSAVRRGDGSEKTPYPIQEVTPKNKEIRIELKMKATNYQSYIAEIWTDAASDKKIFSVSKVNSSRQNGVETITILIPATLFDKGLFSYRLELTGITASDQKDPFTPLPFRIERR